MTYQYLSVSYEDYDDVFLDGEIEEAMERTLEEDFDVRFCPFNFQPVCAGNYFEYFECPKNSEGCRYNLYDVNFEGK